MTMAIRVLASDALGACRVYAQNGQKLTKPEEVVRLTENAWRNLNSAERGPYERRVR